MRAYRVFVLDDVSRMLGVHMIEAGSDLEAVTAAEQIDDAVNREVWHGDRLVARLGPWCEHNGAEKW